jgi:hypothetical protein
MGGAGFPFGVLYQYADDDDEQEDLAAEPRSGISILQRRDFAIADEESVMEAGRRAHREVSGEDDPDEAAAEVSHVGVALYEIGHAHGWDSLVELDGLDPRGSVALVLSSEDLLSSDPGEWPEEDLFDHDEEQMIHDLTAACRAQSVPHARARALSGRVGFLSWTAVRRGPQYCGD